MPEAYISKSMIRRRCVTERNSINEKKESVLYFDTEVFEKLPAMPLDPSTVQIGRGSKIAIDATRQWPEEGGPERFPELNRTLLETIEPDAFANVDQKYGDLIKNWSS